MQISQMVMGIPEALGKAIQDWRLEAVHPDRGIFFLVPRQSRE